MALCEQQTWRRRSTKRQEDNKNLCLTKNYFELWHKQKFHFSTHHVLELLLTSSFYCFLFAKVLIIPHFFRIFAAIFMIVYDEKQNYIGIVEHIPDAHVKYIAS